MTPSNAPTLRQNVARMTGEVALMHHRAPYRATIAPQSRRNQEESRHGVCGSPVARPHPEISPASSPPEQALDFDELLARVPEAIPADPNTLVAEGAVPGWLAGSPRWIAWAEAGLASASRPAECRPGRPAPAAAMPAGTGCPRGLEVPGRASTEERTGAGGPG